jgi:hypothetical protein
MVSNLVQAKTPARAPPILGPAPNPGGAPLGPAPATALRSGNLRAELAGRSLCQSSGRSSGQPANRFFPVPFRNRAPGMSGLWQAKGNLVRWLDGVKFAAVHPRSHALNAARMRVLSGDSLKAWSLEPAGSCSAKPAPPSYQPYEGRPPGTVI